jgi:very-long-chain (3R)-3-hydroxyacyl-CoA dehydratase
MQVWSRIAIVWGPLYLFPSVAQSPFFTTLLLAWGITEVVRYTYFALLLSTGRVPDFLVWLRYNLFFVLYPVGAGSEMVMCWLAARGPGKGTPWEVAMYLLLILHYPFGERQQASNSKHGLSLTKTCVTGFPPLYTHMIKQRRKIMRESAEAKKKTN